MKKKHLELTYCEVVVLACLLKHYLSWVSGEIEKTKHKFYKKIEKKLTNYISQSGKT